MRHDVDGKVWTKSVGTQDIYRLDLATDKWERFQPLWDSAKAGRPSIYQVISDSQNNLWMAEYQRGHIGKIDAKTGKVTVARAADPQCAGAAHGDRRPGPHPAHRIPRQQARAVRHQDEKVKEWQLPPFTYPYRAAVDKNGELWTGGMHTDRAVRLDPKTGAAVEYPLPTETNMRTVFVDNSTTPVTFWTGSNHGAALVKVEPLD